MKTSPLTPYQLNVLSALQAKLAAVAFYPADHEGKQNNPDVAAHDAASSAGFYGGLVAVKRKNSETVAVVQVWHRYGTQLERTPVVTEHANLAEAVTAAKAALVPLL